MDRSVLTIPQDAVQQCERTFGFAPKEQQLEVVEHIGRGEDCILIARCGWGKSLVYFLPLVFWRDCIIMVISPLKVLMHEQRQKLQDMGISSLCLDGGMDFEYNLFDQLDGGKYGAIFTTPEFIFCEDSRAADLWTRVRWIQRLRAVVVDEAHCVTTWGGTFRKSYLRLGELRANVHPQTAFVAVSATLPTKILEDVKRILHFRTPHIINTGNDRPNIRLEVRYFKKIHLTTLDFLTDFEKTIVYLETRKETMAAFNYMKTLVTANDLRKIAPYHALMDSDAKDMAMDKFKKGDIRLLFATEAAGLGCDISDIKRVVQFGYPTDLLTLVQRLGRAARSADLEGLGVLFVPKPSQSTKAIDPDLNRYIIATQCRRRVLNDVFNNDHVLAEDCCDNCHPTQGVLQDTIVMDRAPRHALRAPVRTLEQKETAKTMIREWRMKVFQRDYEPRCDFYTEDLVLPDDAVDKLGDAFAKVKTGDCIKAITGWTLLRRQLDNELAEILVKYNGKIDGQIELDVPDATQVETDASQVQATIVTQTAPKRPFEFVHLMPEDFAKKVLRRKIHVGRPAAPN